MNRTRYYNYIEDKLGTLCYRINLKGKLNILDMHIHSENFYSYFLNSLYMWDLQNVNAVKQNIEAIDLIDKTNKNVVQISATNTKQKIESALNKKIIKTYSKFTFKFISISKDATELRTQIFNNPHGITFTPLTDIIDNKSILNFILSLSIDKQKEIYKLIQKELGGEVDIVKLDSNLAAIINILSKENLSLDFNLQINEFEIEKKISGNEIKTTKSIINEYAKYHPRLDNKYTEFDTQGSNKSLSILQSINHSYVKAITDFKDADSDSILLKVIELVQEKVIQSANYIEIPIDELELCVNIMVVDAFIRCKIFKDPTNYNYANTGQHTP